MFPTETERAGNFDDYLVRSKKAASYLRLLNHSRTCKGACGQPTCRHTYRLLQHTDECNPNGSYRCEIKGCFTTKKLLAHVTDCTARSLRHGEKRDLCLVCTLASKPANASIEKEQFCSEHLEPFQGHSDNNLSYRNISYRSKNNVCRPQSRSQSMSDNTDSSKEEEDDILLRDAYRVPFSQPGNRLSSTFPPHTLNSSKLMEFIVPTMIPKRFRSNTLQHVEHAAVTNNIEIMYTDRKHARDEEPTDFPKEKWLCVDSIARKIPVGQL